MDEVKLTVRQLGFGAAGLDGLRNEKLGGCRVGDLAVIINATL